MGGGKGDGRGGSTGGAVEGGKDGKVLMEWEREVLETRL